MELGEELNQFVLIFDQDVLDRFGLAGVGYKHLGEGREGGRKKGRKFPVVTDQPPSQVPHTILTGRRQTLKTWKASNWMFLLRSLSIVIISFRFSGLLM